MKKSGFTLVELVSTLAVIAILTGLAFPSFQSLRMKIEADVAQKEWVHFLSFGRASAVDYASNITTCPIVNNNCSKSLNNTWQMFTDPNNNRQIDVGEVVIQTYTPDDHSSFTIYRQDQPYFRFYNRPTGIYSGLMKSLTICPNGYPDKYASRITVNVMGRIDSTTKRDANGIPLRKINGRWVQIIC